jgi:hypothetical protein
MSDEGENGMLPRNHLRTFALTGAIVFFGYGAALGDERLPSLNPHPHRLVHWSHAAGAANNHQHLIPWAGGGLRLYIGNGNAGDESAGSPVRSAPPAGIPGVDPNGAGGRPFFDCYSAWDQAGAQALYRNGDAAVLPNFGHGYIRGSVPYAFAPGVPAAARADFNAAITEWRLKGRGQFLLHNAAGGGGLTLGHWFAPGAAEDANFNGVLDPAGGEDVNGNGQLDGFTVTWNVDANNYGVWSTGGGAYTTTHAQNFDAGTVWAYGNAPAGAGTVSFRTIARHEIGHIIGLNHVDTPAAGGAGTSLMRSDIGPNVAVGGGANPGRQFVDFARGSSAGYAALYSQPLPAVAGGAFRVSPAAESLYNVAQGAWDLLGRDSVPVDPFSLDAYLPEFQEIEDVQPQALHLEGEVTYEGSARGLDIEVLGDGDPFFSTFDLLWHPDYQDLLLSVDATDPEDIWVEVFGGNGGQPDVSLGSGSLLDLTNYALTFLGDPDFPPQSFGFDMGLVDVGDIDVEIVPEPGSLLLLAVAPLAIAHLRRRS